MRKITILILALLLITLSVLIVVRLYNKDPNLDTNLDPNQITSDTNINMFDEPKLGYLTGWDKPIIYYDDLSKAIQEVKRRIQNNEKVSGITFSKTRGYDVRNGDEIIEKGTGEITYPLKNKNLKYTIGPKLKYEINQVKFTRADFQNVTGTSLTKHVKYKTPIENASILRCITGLDIHKSQKFDLVISNQSNTGFSITLHGSPDFKTYWRVYVGYLVHNNKDGVQSGNGIFENIGKNKYEWEKKHGLVKHVSFTFDLPYKTPPDIALFLTGFNGEHPTFSYKCVDITTTGFKVVLRKWTTQDINWVKFSWLAKEKTNNNISMAYTNKWCNKGVDCTALFTPPKDVRRYTWKTSNNPNKFIGIHSLEPSSERIRLVLEIKGKDNQAVTWAESRHYTLRTSHVEIK
jgi:hypothetical protein